MKLLFTILLLTLTVSALADIELKFNRRGEFVSPDVLLQQRGLKAYRNGHKSEAVRLLKSSSKFGNDLSKYLTALIYFEDKNFTTGYAWLKLIRNPVEDSDKLIKKYDSQFNKSELATSNATFNQLENDYNDEANLQRRKKWVNSISVVGSHMKGINALSNRNIVLGVGDAGLPVVNTRVRDMVSDYVNNL
jgi:hypothetical protein